ncbi:MAG TPA: S-layer homology domain-containing protein [Thermoanaerobaculia bacterium]|nr:S-layer homology domain-containing protein [Thermoanaerobaculia bacterium]
MVSIAIAGAVIGGATSALLGACGPFTDAAADAFCPFVLEIFYLGITTGTTATTFDPTSNVSRLQMAAFLSRTVDGALRRGSRRAILDEFWTTQNSTVLGLTTVGQGPFLLRSDGADIWVSNFGGAGSVSRVRASDGKLLETWTGSTGPTAVLVAMGKVFVAGKLAPSALYQIDPTQPAGSVTTLASNLGTNASGIAFDGAKIWTGNLGAPGSVSIITPGATIPWTVTNVTAGFSGPAGMLFDGTNIWAADSGNGRLLKLDGNGAILQTVTLGGFAQYPVYDGSNIWVPNEISVTVVRASTGSVLTTLTGNGLNGPFAAAFDGQRVLVTNLGSNAVSLFKAGDLTGLGSFPMGLGTGIGGAASDGIHFWIALGNVNKIARF